MPNNLPFSLSQCNNEDACQPSLLTIRKRTSNLQPNQLPLNPHLSQRQQRKPAANDWSSSEMRQPLRITPRLRLVQIRRR